MVAHDFDSSILSVVAHRPWPMPERPWIMTQTWRDLLFAHWPIDADLLRPLVPDSFELDLFEREAWLGIVPFQMSNVSLRGIPALPWVSETSRAERSRVHPPWRIGPAFTSSAWMPATGSRSRPPEPCSTCRTSSRQA